MGLQVYNKVIRYLLVLSVFCVSMQLIRMYDSQSTTFVKMIWNLFLAWVPMVTAMAMVDVNKRWALISLTALWLLFFPNSPYLVTDLVHLEPSPNYHWFDIGLFYSFAFTGLLTGIISTLMVYGKLRAYFSMNVSRLIIMGFMYAAGFGVYVGRFLRWNSWDVAVRPMHLVETMWQHVASPMEYKLAWGVTLMGGSLLFAVFLFFDAIVQLPQAQTPPHTPTDTPHQHNADAQKANIPAQPKSRSRDNNQDLAQHPIVDALI